MATVPTRIVPSHLSPFASEVLSSLDSAKGVTAATAAGAQAAVCQARTNGVTYLCEGTTPTATKGISVAAGEVFVLGDAVEVNKFKCIEITASATVDIQYYK